MAAALKRPGHGLDPSIRTTPQRVAARHPVVPAGGGADGGVRGHGPDEFGSVGVVGGLAVSALSSTTGEDFDIMLPPPTDHTCVEGIAAILEAGFKLVNSSGGFNPALTDVLLGPGTGIPGSEALFTRYTFLKTTKMRVLREED